MSRLWRQRFAAFFSLPVDMQANVNLDYSSTEPRIFQNSHAVAKIAVRSWS